MGGRLQRRRQSRNAVPLPWGSQLVAGHLQRPANRLEPGRQYGWIRLGAGRLPHLDRQLLDAEQDPSAVSLPWGPQLVAKDEINVLILGETSTRSGYIRGDRSTLK